MVVKVCPIFNSPDWIYCHDGIPSNMLSRKEDSTLCASWDDIKHICRLIDRGTDKNDRRTGKSRK